MSSKEPIKLSVLKCPKCGDEWGHKPETPEVGIIYGKVVKEECPTCIRRTIL